MNQCRKETVALVREIQKEGVPCVPVQHTAAYGKGAPGRLGGSSRQQTLALGGGRAVRFTRQRARTHRPFSSCLNVAAPTAAGMWRTCPQAALWSPWTRWTRSGASRMQRVCRVLMHPSGLLVPSFCAGRRNSPRQGVKHAEGPGKGF